MTASAVFPIAVANGVMAVSHSCAGPVVSHSETWSALGRKLHIASAKWGVALKMQNRLETFVAVTQLARCGFGHGIVPLAVALALGVPRSKLVPFPGKGISLPVSLVGRGSTLDRTNVKALYESLQKYTKG